MTRLRNELVACASPCPSDSPSRCGLELKAIAQPYRFFLLKRVQEAVAARDDWARECVDDLLARCNRADVLMARLDRKIGWADNRKVCL
ncbi:MAG TPA: hypothetical protein EYQ66_14355 [Myxococcales bacterium]|nr:hypothetical protein [Myxococcales bacterium]